jgi:hypothetical protein
MLKEESFFIFLYLWAIQALLLAPHMIINHNYHN